MNGPDHVVRLLSYMGLAGGVGTVREGRGVTRKPGGEQMLH